MDVKELRDEVGNKCLSSALAILQAEAIPTVAAISRAYGLMKVAEVGRGLSKGLLEKIEEMCLLTAFETLQKETVATAGTATTVEGLVAIAYKAKKITEERDNTIPTFPDFQPQSKGDLVD